MVEHRDGKSRGRGYDPRQMLQICFACPSQGLVLCVKIYFSHLFFIFKDMIFQVLNLLFMYFPLLVFRVDPLEGLQIAQEEIFEILVYV